MPTDDYYGNQVSLADRLDRIPCLRDQFAMAALTGICARSDNGFPIYESSADAALEAYAMADAMIIAMDK